MAEGIRVPVKLDLSKLKADIKDLEKELAKAQKEVAEHEETYNPELRKKQYDLMRSLDEKNNDGAKRDVLDKEEAKANQKDLEHREQLNEKVQEYNALLEQAKAKLQEYNAIQQANSELGSAIKGERELDKITTQKEYNSKLAETKAEMARIEKLAQGIADANGVTVEKVLAQNQEYQKLSDLHSVLTGTTRKFAKESERAGAGMRKAKTEATGFGAAIQGALKKIGKMSLAVFGIRGAYRAVRMALTEYLATNQQLAGQIDTLKSLFGQVLGPAIEWVVNLLIKGVAAINSFVYALTGINFVAKANAAALKKQAEASQQTAGFDEQTKLSGNGSESGVGTLPDGTSMDLSFLDPMMEALRKFKEDISPLIETMGNLFKWLWEEVLVPLGDWILNSWFPAWLDQLGACLLVVNDALLALQPMALWIWENFLEPIASWTGGVILDVITGIGNWIREHHETLGKLVAAIAAVLIAVEAVSFAMSALTVVMGLLTSPVTWIIAAITGLVVLFVEMYDSCEGFRAGIDQAFTAIKDIFFASIEFIKALFEGDWAGMDAAWAKIKEAGKSLWEGLLSGLKAGWEWCRDKVVEIWGKIVTKFKEIFGIHSPSTVFAEFGKYMMEGLVNGIRNAISMVTNACNQIWTAIKNVFASVGTWFKDTFTAAWKNVKNVFSTGGKIFDGIKDGIASTFKTIVNGLITGINKVIATPFKSINGMLNTIRGITILGVSPFKNLWSYNPLSIPQIPKLALGGIVNRPGRGVPAIIGEAGAEAVLPLENNTEWMDILADKINGGNVTIPIYMDGKKIYTYMVDIGKRKAFAANGV